MLHRAREYDVRRSPLRAALEQHLNGRGLMVEDIVRAEQQRQAASQASVANAITSLRLCTTIDWREYVEGVSLVDNVLRRDPSGVYSRMDFLSRDRQRRAVEELAEPTAESQIRVALKAVETARQVASQSRSRAAAHVGYHLIGRGRAGLELDLGYRPKLKSRVRRARQGARDARCISASIAIDHGAARARARSPTRGCPAHRARCSPRSALLFLIPASELAIAFVQKLASRLVHPEPLPRLELARRRPRRIQDHRRHPDAADEHRGRRVAARTSRSGADRQSRSADSLRDPLRLRRCRQRASPSTTRRSWRRRDRASRTSTSAPAAIRVRSSSCFHRDRQWNEREQVWMGWERKRGKLEEFNRLVRGATDTSFTTQVGPLDALAGIKYCITLDSDTQLPRDAARELIGIISHPLNRPVDRSEARARHRRLRHPAAARQRDDGERGGLAVRAHLRRPHRRRSVHDRGVGRVSGSVRRGHLHRQGPLRHRRVHDGARGSRAGECAALARPVRRHSRAGRARHRRRGRRRLSVERADARAPPASLGARRLADPVVAVPVGADARRPRAQPPAAHLALEDPRQPAAQPRGAVARGAVHRRLVVPARTADRVDARRARDDVVPGHRARPLAACADRARAWACACSCARGPRISAPTSRASRFT